jgi:hypothetical protein
MVPTRFQPVSRELITLRLIFCVDRASDTRTVTEELSLGNRSAYLGDSGLARELGNFSGCGVDKIFLGREPNPETRFLREPHLDFTPSDAQGGYSPVYGYQVGRVALQE